MDKYELHRPHLSCQPGEIESFIYKLKKEFTPSESDPKFMLVNQLSASDESILEASYIKDIMETVFTLDEPEPLDR